MIATAKVFDTGNSQAVRLPKAFRVNVKEMWITKNNVTGEITLKPKDEDQRKRNLKELFRLIAENPFPKDFSFRDESAPIQYPSDPFAESDPQGSSK